MKIRIAACTVLLFLHAFPVFAADEKAINAALQLFETMNMRQTLSRVIEQITLSQIQKDPALGPYKDVMLKFMDKHMGFDSVKMDFAAIYAEAFTESELREIAAFYRTPVGQKAMQKLPELSVKGSEYGQRKVQENLGELRAMITEESKRIQELQKK